MKKFFLVDLKKDKSKISPYLSETLIEEINNSLSKWKKVLLYLNKRGYSNFLICSDCNHIYKCPNCDISMTLHKDKNKLICHHCFFSREIPITCEKCKSVNLKKIWVWIEQIEEKIKTLWQDKNIIRMDSDNIKSIKDKKNALLNMSKADIIIWTKMVTTWFDFTWIDCIWIILLEQELQIPNYKTEENVYANIKQLIWRRWRKWNEWKIIIQTYCPNNKLIKKIIDSNYKDFFSYILKERKLFWYPPFIEMASIQYKNADKEKSFLFLKEFKEKLEESNKKQKEKKEIILIDNILKRNNKYYSKIIIKWKNLRTFLQEYKEIILKTKNLTITFE